MATQLATVNKILRRLRETTVASVASTSYAQLIGLFVNEAKEMMEDAWFWTVNETAIDTSILADGTLTYDLTETNDRSFLMRWHNEGMPMAFDTTSGGEKQLADISLKERNRIRETWNGDPDASTPCYTRPTRRVRGVPTGTYHRLSWLSTGQTTPQRFCCPNVPSTYWLSALL
jgi:hypothetical protein